MTRGELKRQAKTAMRTSSPHYAFIMLAVLIFWFVLMSVQNALAPDVNSYELPSTAYSIFSLLVSIVSVMVDTGLKWYGLMLIRGNGKNAGRAFTLVYGCFITVLITAIIIVIFTALWALLLVIPGIIAFYRYRMTMYIIHDDPEVGILEAIRKSKQMMIGRKMELFLLDLSFLGWGLLCVITLGIAALYVVPYFVTTQAAFYDSIQRT